MDLKLVSVAAIRLVLGIPIGILSPLVLSNHMLTETCSFLCRPDAACYSDQRAVCRVYKRLAGGAAIVTVTTATVTMVTEGSEWYRTGRTGGPQTRPHNTDGGRGGGQGDRGTGAIHGRVPTNFTKYFSMTFP